MKTATIREAQHHLSKLVDEVCQSGQEIVLTRRGEEVCKISPIAPAKAKEVDWKGWLEERENVLRDMPVIEGSAMDIEREGYRW
jgi:prevent-host-death family protein